MRDKEGNNLSPVSGWIDDWQGKDVFVKGRDNVSWHGLLLCVDTDGITVWQEPEMPEFIPFSAFISLRLQAVVK